MSLPRTVADAWRALRAGRVTSEELVDRALAAARDPAGEGARAFIRLDEDGARASAREADARRRSGRPAGALPLDGIPVSIKDLFDMAGEVTTAGSLVLASRPPAAQDALAIQRLKAAGAIVVGRTNMTEWAYGAVGMNGHHGTPRCAWDRGVDGGVGRVPGGSTSGGAISVTDGMALAALGSDTGGSVRIPAALNGTCGFKPTARRVPLRGVLPLSRLDSVGPLAPTLDDCARLFAVLSGESMADHAARPLAGLRLGVVTPELCRDLDHDVAAAFERALSALSSTGAVVVEVGWPEADELPGLMAHGGFSAAETWARHGDLLRQRAGEIDAWVARRAEAGARQSEGDLRALEAARADWIARSEARLRAHDAILAPTCPVVAPRLRPIVDALPDLAPYFDANIRLLAHCQLINFLDGCAATLPIHRHGEAPVGLMITGLAMADERILSIGMAIEEALSPLR